MTKRSKIPAPACARKKSGIQLKRTANFFLFMNPTEEKIGLGNRPTSGTTGYINVVIDSIVHDKVQEFINRMGPFYQSPYEEISGNDQNTVLPSSTQQQMLMQSLWKALNKFSIKCFKIKIQKLKGRNDNKSPLICKRTHDANGLHITYCLYHGITSNLRHSSEY